MPNCITGSLAPYQPSSALPWDKKRIQHLYNRIGYGANLEEINIALTKTPAQLIDELIDEAIAYPLPDVDKFPWAHSPYFTALDPPSYPDRIKRYDQLIMDFAGGSIISPVIHKLVLFWHGHFVTETPRDSQIATYIFLYYHLLHKYAFGNFKEFVMKMGLNPRMLLYLSGYANVAAAPNENYARELLELFTLGEGNYTQQDVENIAKGLTGWTASRYSSTIIATYPDDTIFLSSKHDWTNITLFGETYISPSQPSDAEEAKATAYEEYTWIHDTIFSKKEDVLSKHICRKLYQFYVYHEADEDIVAGMASTFVNSGWQIDTVLRQLFKSEHFFNQHVCGLNIKSPMELFSSFYKQTGLIHNTHWFMVHWAGEPFYDPEYPFHNTEYVNSNYNHAFINAGSSSSIGQALFRPHTVAGWPGARAWINEFSIVNRWERLRSIIDYYLKDPLVINAVDQQYRQFLIDVSGNSTDPEVITRATISHYMIVEPEEDFILGAVEEFKSPLPSNYFEEGVWNLYYDEVPEQFRRLIKYISRLPEFQMS